VESTDDPWNEYNGSRTQNSYDSSSNSNNSSISSLSASSSDSDYKITGPSELEADADSLACRQSMMASADRLGSDGPKLVCCYLFLKKYFLFFQLENLSR
jgi:mediator of RNA polymerase II transcription subunit 13